MTEITGLPKKDEGFSRLDKILYALCSMSNFEEIEVPQSRIEEYYYSLITTNTFNLPIPQSRVEHLLNLIIKGEDLGVEVPQSRIEYLLYVLAELMPKEELPFVVTEASSRHERYLWYLIENGGMNLELLTIEFYESETIYNTKDAQVRECEIDGSTILSIEKTKVGTEEFDVITSIASIGTPSDTKMKIEDDVYKSAILSGQTKYRDTETGDILDSFDNTKKLELISVKMPVLSSIGKNLCGKMELGSLNTSEGLPEESTTRIRTIDYIPLQQNYYTISTETTTVVGRRYYDENKKFIINKTANTSQTPVTVLDAPSNAKFLKLTVVDVADINYKIYVTNEAHKQGEYEPHKSNILSTPSDLILRGVGDVKDTLNINTGEVVKRIGEHTFNGSESWVLNTDFVNETLVEFRRKPDFDVKSVLCSDKFLVGGNGERIVFSGTLLYFKILKSKVTTVDELKTWLSNNNVTIQYELATPTIKTVALSIVDQSGNALEKPIAYKKGHIMLSSNTINPSMKYSLWSSNTYTLSPLKSNNTYTTKSDGSNYILNNVTHSGVNELVTINTLANNKLYTDDSEFKIVYGMHLNEDLSNIHGFATTRSPVLKLEHEGTVNTHSTSNLSLRSVDDGVTEVYDTLNVKTKELIKRCAELVFDGTETNWIFFGVNTNTVGAYMKNIEDMRPDINIKSISNLAIGKGSDVSLDEQSAYLRGDSKTLFIKVNKDRLVSHDLVGIKQFLADEAAKGTPIRVCYELVEPQTMQVEIESSGDMVTYSDFTNVSVTVEEGSIKPKRVKIKVVTKNTDTLSGMYSLKLTQIDNNKKTQQQSDINIVSMVATSDAFEGSLGL